MAGEPKMPDVPKPIGDTPKKIAKDLRISDPTRKGLRRKVLDARASRQEAPKHGDLISDLEDKKHESEEEYKQLMEAIDAVCGCVEPDDALKNIRTSNS